VIDNPRSPRVRAVAKLAKKSRRHEADLFLVEGPQSVREALSHQPDRVVDVFMTEPAQSKHAELVDAARQAGLGVETVTDEVLGQMADTSTPQGVVAVHQMSTPSLQQVLDRQPRLVVALDRVSDPGNAGTIIRVAVAAGADAVVVTDESVDIFNPKVVRSTTGSIFHLPIATSPTVADLIPSLSQAGLQVLAADTSGDFLPEVAEEGSLAQPTAWVFGNEAHGLDESTLAAVDRVVSVPQFGPVESMNLATAAAVCIFQSAFALRPARASE
jgi:TrmH family RNA methyltransferase